MKIIAFELCGEIVSIKKFNRREIVEQLRKIKGLYLMNYIEDEVLNMTKGRKEKDIVITNNSIEFDISRLEIKLITSDGKTFDLEKYLSDISENDISMRICRCDNFDIILKHRLVISQALDNVMVCNRILLEYKGKRAMAC